MNVLAVTARALEKPQILLCVILIEVSGGFTEREARVGQPRVVKQLVRVEKSVALTILIQVPVQVVARE